jgi:hypothetical protein
MVKKHLPILQFLLAILTVLAVYARHSGFSTALFWPVLWMLITVTFIIAYYYPKKFKVAALIFLVSTIAIIKIAAIPQLYFLDGDEIFEAQFGSLITKSGYWNPTLGSGLAEGYYGYNPVLHFIIAFISLITGFNSYFVTKYLLFVLYKILIMLLAYLVLENFISKQNIQLAYIAIFMFIGSAGFSYIGVTRRATASIFVLLSILSILKMESSHKKVLWNALFMVFSALAVLSNRSISFYLLFFLSGAFLFSIVMRYIPGMRVINAFPDIAFKLLYFALVFATWQISYRRIFLIEDITYFNQIKDIVIGPEGIRELFQFSGDSVKVSIYRPYETFAIYGSQVLLLTLGGIGFIFFFFNMITKKDLVNNWVKHLGFLVYYSIFGFAMFLFSSLLMRTPLDTAVYIFLWFFILPITIFAAYFLDIVVSGSKLKLLDMLLPAIQCLAIIFFISASLLMGYYTPRVTNRGPQEDIIAEYDVRSHSKSLYYSGLWLSKRENIDVTSLRVLGDRDVYSVFSGFFLIDVNPYKLWVNTLYKGSEDEIMYMIQRENFEFGSYFHNRYYDKLDYFIVNTALERYPSLTFGDRIDMDTCEVLNSINLLDKVYSNNDIYLYRIERGDFIE